MPAPPVQAPANQIWQAGQWVYANNEYHWVAGHYETIPAAISTPPAPPDPVPAIVVQSEPPPVRIEVIPPQPDDGFVWVAGYWTWRVNSWLWIGGSWCRPPHSHVVWIEPRWDHEGDHWHFNPGRWHDHDGRDEGHHDHR